MGFIVEVDDTGGVTTTFSGWDLAMTMRRQVRVEPQQIERAWGSPRGPLEQMIERRIVGRGSHSGLDRPNGARVGSMLGRGEQEVQYWAVRGGTANDQVLVLDLRGHDFGRLVLSVDGDPHVVADAITRLGST
jgi:hypothetical protein